MTPQPHDCNYTCTENHPRDKRGNNQPPRTCAQPRDYKKLSDSDRQTDAPSGSETAVAEGLLRKRKAANAAAPYASPRANHHITVLDELELQRRYCKIRPSLGTALTPPMPSSFQNLRAILDKRLPVDVECFSEFERDDGHETSLCTDTPTNVETESSSTFATVTSSLSADEPSSLPSSSLREETSSQMELDGAGI
eukprot:807617-Ditylum_brightwellii.AAC.1